MLRFIVLFLLIIPGLSQAAFEERHFDDPEKAAVFRELTFELRCLVCQNQNIADSGAELAVDLRREIFAMLNQGDSKSQIIDFMVERYGDFVLYKPRFNITTLALWLGPFVFLALGLIVLVRIARRPAAAGGKSAEPDQAALERARALLAENNGSSANPSSTNRLD